MQSFIKVQNVLIDPRKSFLDFKSELQKSQISQFTYICLLLNIAVTIKRPHFQFQKYLQLLVNFRQEGKNRSAYINYTGYKDKISILMNACEKSTSKTVKILVKQPEIRLYILDPNGMNAAFYAIRNHDQTEGYRILEILYDASPQIINSVINNGYSTLFLAVEKFRLRCVEFLLNKGVNPHQKLVNSGNTALHEFFKYSSKYSVDDIKKMIAIFISHSFDKTVQNNAGKNIDQLAQEHHLNINETLGNFSQWGFCQGDSQTEQQSSKQTTLRGFDGLTMYNFSDLGSQPKQIDNLSITNRSEQYPFSENTQLLLKQEEQLSVLIDPNPTKSNQRFQEFEDFSEDEIEQKEEVRSETDNCEKFLEKQRVECQSVFNSSENSEESSFEMQLCPAEQIQYERLEKQLLQFDEISCGAYFSVWEQIQPFFTKLQQIANSLGLSLQVIGSFATGLWTYYSDIDVALITENYVDFERLLQKVYSKLKINMYYLGIKLISLNRISKIPSIQIQMDPYLYNSRKIDLMVFGRKNIAFSYVNYIKEALISYPQVRPIFFTLKRICEEFNLHNPLQGGLKTYSIFLIVFSIVSSSTSSKISETLLKIALYYGFYHEYSYEQNQHSQNIKNSKSHSITIDIKNPQLQLQLNLKDPLNVRTNISGKNTDISRLRHMFRTIYYALHMKIQKGTTLQYILELAHLL